MSEFDETAQKIAARIRASNKGYLTVRRDELREQFGIGRLTENLSRQIEAALDHAALFILPSPADTYDNVLRIYEKGAFGDLVISIFDPSNSTEAPLARYAEQMQRAKRGADLRSDDAPWLTIFDVFLQVVMGREPEGWEELNDERHPNELAQQLATALDLPRTTVQRQATLRLAAAVCAVRPRRRSTLLADQLAMIPEADDSHVRQFLDAKDSAERRMREEHERLLTLAAKLLLGTNEVPTRSVEVGVLGLRFRREDNERSH